MSRCEKLLIRAQAAPNNYSFSNLLKLAACYGYTQRRIKGSHHIFVKDTPHSMLNFQPHKSNPSKAKAVQVRALIKAILAEHEREQP